MKINGRDFSVVFRNHDACRRRYCAGLAMVFVLLLLSYGNSFNCSWHLDDFDNITDNASIQIKELTWENVKKVSLGIMNTGLLSRPFSYISLALNYYFGGLNVFGYHAVNFSIHFLSFVFLFLFIFNTLKLPILKDRYEKHAYTIALLSALLWAINPVQVTAVTYIVQRMASMAALFYMMSMYFYLRFRTAHSRIHLGFYMASCILCGMIAIGSKENAVMLPVSIFMYDLFFIQGLTIDNLKKNCKIFAIPVLVILLAAVLFYDFSADLKDYQYRPFTMRERLLTEPRVILYYISLLFYPVAPRLTLIHDIQISKSLFDPWTTIVAISTIPVLVGAALVKAKKWPLVVYCILFFFLNHAIEGSFFSLEIIFEHRNYLPSMLLFVPFSIGYVKLLESYTRRKGIFYLLVGSMTFVMIALAVGVRIQNDIMKDDLSLWSDNVEKSPRLHHPRQWLAVSLFNAGRLPEAHEQLMIATELYESGRTTKKSLTYGCLGEYYWRTGNDDKAVAYFLKSMNLDPPYTYVPLTFDRMARIYMKKDMLDKAEAMSRKSISLKPSEAEFHLTYAAILLKKRQPDAAIKSLQKSLRLRPDSVIPYGFLADAFALKNNPDAERHFRRLSR